MTTICLTKSDNKASVTWRDEAHLRVRTVTQVSGSQYKSHIKNEPLGNGRGSSRKRVGRWKQHWARGQVITVTFHEALAMGGSCAEHFECIISFNPAIAYEVSYRHFSDNKTKCQSKKKVPEITQLSKWQSRDLNQVCLLHMDPRSPGTLPLRKAGFELWFFHCGCVSWNNYFMSLKVLLSVKCK